MSPFPIESVDADGAIREAEKPAAGDTRAAFLHPAAIGGGTVLGSFDAEAPAAAGITGEALKAMEGTGFITGS